MMRVTTFDLWATSGTSWLHRTSALAKWLLIAAAVLVAILSRSPWPLACAYAVLLAAGVSAGLPARTLALLSLLPVPLVGLYALSRWDGSLSGLAVPVTIVGKGMVTSLAGLLAVATTPYPDLLAPLTGVLPRTLADSLVLTYRGIFLLWARAETLWIAVRARGASFVRPRPGALPWAARGTSLRRRVEVAAAGLALATVRGADLSATMYDVMRLRGYQGRLAPARPLGLRTSDWRAAALGLALLAPAVATRVAGA
jgi:energy-coupling factor transporter transmembrane protein EcfT